MLITSRPGEDFNLPKLHSFLHYGPAIKEFGTTDNYNTETTESLHINYAKDAYRAGNKREGFTDNMVRWLSRVEKIELHVVHVQWAEGIKPAQPPAPPRLYLTKTPSVKGVTLTTLATSYHAPTFPVALRAFLEQFAPSPGSRTHALFISILDAIPNLRLRFPVWHRIRISNASIQDVNGIADRSDAIVAVPSRKKRKSDERIGQRFDTAVVDEKGEAGIAGIKGMYLTGSFSEVAYS